MHYLVRARFREETAAELSRLLRDGTIARQRPDGPEIVASMQRAVVTAKRRHRMERGVLLRAAAAA